MALDKTFSAGEILSASNVNGHLLSMWIPIDKRVISSGSPSTVVTFSGIDSNFRAFRLTYHVIPTGGLWLRLNNDSGSNYAQQKLTASHTTVVGFRLASSISIDMSGGASNVPMQGQVLVSKISTSALARGTAQYSFDSHANVQVETSAISWNNTSSLINRIDLVAPSGNFYGVVALEGMRGV